MYVTMGDESHRHDVLWKKPAADEDTLFDHVYMKVKDRQSYSMVVEISKSMANSGAPRVLAGKGQKGNSAG